MSEWDSAAAGYLDDVVRRLDGAGVAGWLRGHVGEIWRRNTARHDEPSGDTALVLGIRSAENLRELVVREFRDRDGSPGAALPGRDVLVSAPGNSLLVQACGVHLHVLKAGPAPTRTPSWWGSEFDWDGGSEVRRHAAADNSDRYRPDGSDQYGRRLVLPLPGVPVEAGDARELRQAFLVWSGEPGTGLTAGWLGFPCLDRPSWFAITRLWWDEP